MRQHERAMRSFLAEIGATDVRCEHSGHHPRLVFTWRGRMWEQRFPWTPRNVSNAAIYGVQNLRRTLGLALEPKRKRPDEERRRKRSHHGRPHGRADDAPPLSAPQFARRAMPDNAPFNSLADALAEAGVGR